MDIHVKLYKTEIQKKSLINTGTKVYKNLPRFIKQIDCKAPKKQLKTVSSSSHLLLSGRIYIFLAIYL